MSDAHPGEPAGLGDHLLRWPVPPRLAGLVTDIAHYRETVAGVARQVETASLVVPLVIVLGERFAVGLGRDPDPRDLYRSFASGLFPGHVVIASHGTMECVQVNFTPLGARRFFGLPMSELSSRMVEVADLADTGLASLRDRLGSTSGVAARLRLATDFVTARLSAQERPDPMAAAAYALMQARRGDLRIADLAAHLSISRKHLAERFRETIGVPPKTLARIMRFNHAQALARAGGEWADIAAACGYADQAHLAREFHDLSGSTPTAWQTAA